MSPDCATTSLVSAENSKTRHGGPLRFGFGLGCIVLLCAGLVFRSVLQAPAVQPVGPASDITDFGAAVPYTPPVTLAPTHAVNHLLAVHKGEVVRDKHLRPSHTQASRIHNKQRLEECQKLKSLLDRPWTQTRCDAVSKGPDNIKGNLVEPIMIELGWGRTGGNDGTKKCRGHPCWKCRERVEIQAFHAENCFKVMPEKDAIQEELRLETKLLDRQANDVHKEKMLEEKEHNLEMKEQRMIGQERTASWQGNKTQERKDEKEEHTMRHQEQQSSQQVRSAIMDGKKEEHIFEKLDRAFPHDAARNFPGLEHQHKAIEQRHATELKDLQSEDTKQNGINRWQGSINRQENQMEHGGHNHPHRGQWQHKGPHPHHPPNWANIHMHKAHPHHAGNHHAPPNAKKPAAESSWK